MHYAELSHLIEDQVPWTELTQNQADVFVRLKNALVEGQGYVAITLDPDGLRITPVQFDGNSQMTVRAKQTLRKIAHDVQVYSGTSTSYRSRTVDQG